VVGVHALRLEHGRFWRDNLHGDSRRHERW
jgi:hypothetical protein